MVNFYEKNTKEKLKQIERVSQVTRKAGQSHQSTDDTDSVSKAKAEQYRPSNKILVDFFRVFFVFVAFFVDCFVLF